METSRLVQHSSITLIGSDYSSIAPCIHSVSLTVVHDHRDGYSTLVAVYQPFSSSFSFGCFLSFFLSFVLVCVPPNMPNICIMLTNVYLFVSFQPFAYFSPSIHRLWWGRAWCIVCNPKWRRVPNRRAASTLEAVVSTPSYAERCASSVRQTTSPIGVFWREGVFRS